MTGTINNQSLNPQLQNALEASYETSFVEFKEKLDVGNKGDWVEVIKDLVAMANSGGGFILFGVDDNAKPTGESVEAIISYDASRIGDKICKFTDTPFGDFTLQPALKAGVPIAVIQISASRIPLVFTTDGQYTNPHGDEKFAFRKGTVYFRHGAKSEPGTTGDLQALIERELERIKHSWLAGIRTVVEAPPGSTISVAVPIEQSVVVNPNRVRLVSDGDAPAVQLIDPNKTHPHLWKNVLTQINLKLNDGVKLTTHDVLGIRRLYQMDSNSLYRWKANSGGSQYSEAFIQWVVTHINESSNSLAVVRTRHQKWVLDRKVGEKARIAQAKPSAIDT